MKKAFEKVSLGSAVLPNRFVMGSMHLGMEGSADSAEIMAAFYAERFDGGVGLIVTGGIGVNEEGRGSRGFFNMQKEEDALELKKMNGLLAGKGIMCAQLFHAGRYAFFRECVAPSAIRAPINRFVPKELSTDECWKTVEDFGKSAKIASEIGFGAVEIMGSEGYLINQFCSPVTNTRNDFFGGNNEKRMNFAIEVLRSVRRHLPENFPVIFRMSGIDMIPGSSDFSFTAELAKRLNAEGASALNIGIGWHESRVPTISQLVPRAAFAGMAEKIKREVPDALIIVSNRIAGKDDMEKIFSNDQADLISMARPFLADAAILNKIRDNEADRVNTCIACNQACLDHAFLDLTASCVVNPRAVRELEYKTDKNIPKKVAVIGSGPAGLEAARAAAELGHSVTLIEKGERLGGQFLLASEIPGKSEFLETLRYFRTELKRLGVNVILQRNADIHLLKELNPDAVILAAGVVPRTFSLPGMDKIPTGTYTDYLTGKFKPGKKTAVIGGGGIGVDVAHKLVSEKNRDIDSYYKRYNISSYNQPVIQKKDSGRKTAVFRRNGKHGAGLGPTTFWALKQELEFDGVEFYQGLQYKEFKDGALIYETKDGSIHSFECDSAIICTGQESENSLAESLQMEFADRQIFIIGGARDSKGIDAKRAFQEGLEAAYAVGRKK